MTTGIIRRAGLAVWTLAAMAATAGNPEEPAKSASVAPPVTVKAGQTLGMGVSIDPGAVARGDANAVGVVGVTVEPAPPKPDGGTGGADRGAGADATPATQIGVSCQILEMPPQALKKVFGGQVAVAPGSDMTDALLQRLLSEPGVVLVSNPKVVAWAGRSAQIKVCEERSFASSFRVDGKTGRWEPVVTNLEYGLAVTVMASPYPNDLERIRGTVEVSLTELAGVGERTVTPPGQAAPLKLELPTIATRAIATTVDVRSGRTTVLGALEGTKDGKPQITLVLVKAEILSNAEPEARLKGKVLPTVEFKNVP